MSELKPCPFCGGEAEKLTSIDGFTSIGCLNCNPFYGVMIQRNAEAEAIAAWNTRAPIEYEGWFYLPKPRDGIIDYGELEITRTENGCKIKQPVEVIESAIRSWGDELGEYAMKRICEAWNSRAERTCKPLGTIRYDYEGGYAGFEYETELSCGHKWRDAYGDYPDYCPSCGCKVVGE